MIWLFERDEAIVRIDTRYDKDTAEYVLRFTDALGRRVERFSDRTLYQRRLVALVASEAELETEAWHCRGTPQIVS